MKAFKDFTADERWAFIFAFTDAAPDAAYIWAYPWGYAPDWMVEATDPEDAARAWCGLWQEEIDKGLDPTEMQEWFA